MLDLKVVIIGGGIAGLSAAIALKKDKKKVVVREKYSMKAKSGLAFMIHSKTLDDIQSLTDAQLDLTEN
jgi:glycine/D-amino acid oxidase-like deaminating enzyme